MDSSKDDSDIGDYVYDTEGTEDEDENNILSKYEFAPRAVQTPPVSKPTRGRNSLTDWTEKESSVLLEAWGERFLKHNRKSVRSEEWLEVAQLVSDVSRCKRTKTQCRNRLDTLKKKYKKEKAMLAENVGMTSNWVHFNKMDMLVSPSFNHLYGKILNSSDEIKENGKLKVDRNSAEPSDKMVQNVKSKVRPNGAKLSDEMVQIVNLEVNPNRENSSDNMKEIVNSKIDTNRANSSDEIKEIVDSEGMSRANSSDKTKQISSSKFPPNRADSLNEKTEIVDSKIKKCANSSDKIKILVDSEDLVNRANSSGEMKDSFVGDSESQKEESDKLEENPPKRMKREKSVGDPFKLLADSIDKFSNMYEKIENNKIKQLVELEKMRMDFQRDLELQKRKIMRRTQMEIARIWGHKIEENDLSPGNISG